MLTMLLFVILSLSVGSTLTSSVTRLVNGGTKVSTEVSNAVRPEIEKCGPTKSNSALSVPITGVTSTTTASTSVTVSAFVTS